MLGLLLFGVSSLSVLASGASAPSSGGYSKHCTFSPTCRSQWSHGLSVWDDTDEKWPRTGKVREYWFTISNAKCNPDGFAPYDCSLVNNQYPGPAITADWGDTVRVHVHNALEANGTSLHFHGIRQFRTNLQDGVNGITECPLAPGHSRTYEWTATQYGSSWYHSHHASQYGSGVFGPIVIKGPASANYDIDLGPLILHDWWHNSFWTISALANENTAAGLPPPGPDNFLLNGKNKDGNGHGEYHEIKVQPGKTHLIRLVNTAGEDTFRFSIDNHTMTVIAADFVPVTPFKVDSIMVGIAQRYDVLITADQHASSYWIRSFPESSACSGTPKHPGVGVLKYANSHQQIPSTPEPTNSSHTGGNCAGPQGICPLWKPSIPKRQFLSKYQPLILDFNIPTTGIPQGQDEIVWKFNSTGIDVMWDKPTVSYVAEGNTSYPLSLAVIDLKNKPGDWAFFVIQTVPSFVTFISHPIHLHGHDFYTLGLGQGTFDPAKDFAGLNFYDPPRRDTDYILGDNMTKTGSWMAFAFQTGNPGAWLLHCHIISHIGTGMGLQFLDTKRQIKGLSRAGKKECRQWSDYYVTAAFKKDDSGL